MVFSCVVLIFQYMLNFPRITATLFFRVIEITPYKFLYLCYVYNSVYFFICKLKINQMLGCANVHLFLGLLARMWILSSIDKNWWKYKYYMVTKVQRNKVCRRKYRGRHSNTSIYTIFFEDPVSQRRYSQSGNDRDEMVEIKKSRVSCYIFSIFMNNLIQWRKSEAGLPKLISDFVSNPKTVLTSLCLLNKISFK
jgi:hypothetical protein